MVEPPAEIVLKKMYHRATMLTPRDDLLRRVNSISVDYLKADLAELDIQAGWEL